MEATESVAKTTFIVADYFGAISALVLMLSIIPLAAVLMKTKTFKEVEQPMPEVTEDKQTKEWLWWLFATANFIDSGDKNCPFCGSVKIRGKTFTGKVISDKMNKTCTIEWARKHYIPNCPNKSVKLDAKILLADSKRE